MVTDAIDLRDDGACDESGSRRGGTGKHLAKWDPQRRTDPLKPNADPKNPTPRRKHGGLGGPRETLLQAWLLIGRRQAAPSTRRAGKKHSRKQEKEKAAIGKNHTPPAGPPTHFAVADRPCRAGEI